MKDSRFLDKLREESVSRFNSHFLRKACKKTYEYYKTMQDLEFRHLLTPLKFYQKAGVDFILNKPFRLENLRDAVAKVTPDGPNGEASAN